MRGVPQPRRPKQRSICCCIFSKHTKYVNGVVLQRTNHTFPLIMIHRYSMLFARHYVPSVQSGHYTHVIIVKYNRVIEGARALTHISSLPPSLCFALLDWISAGSSDQYMASFHFFGPHRTGLTRIFQSSHSSGRQLHRTRPLARFPLLGPCIVICVAFFHC